MNNKNQTKEDIVCLIETYKQHSSVPFNLARTLFAVFLMSVINSSNSSFVSEIYNTYTGLHQQRALQQ